jgi:hypothetical protein
VGEFTTQDEAGMPPIKTVELDDYLSGFLYSIEKSKRGWVYLGSRETGWR